jgi:hypothetical protein
MRHRLASWTLFCAFAAVGCGTFVTPTYLSDTPYATAPRAPRAVRIYASGPPARPHTDLALLRVDQTSGLNAQGTDVMLKRLREQAGAMGCDGVVLLGQRNSGGAHRGEGLADLLDPAITTLDATCIVFDQDDQPADFPMRRSVASASAGTGQRIDGENPRD